MKTSHYTTYIFTSEIANVGTRIGIQVRLDHVIIWKMDGYSKQLF